MDVETDSKKSLHRKKSILDQIVLLFVKVFGLFMLPGWCNVCRKPTIFLITDRNLRENVLCIWCRSSNRKRQMMYVFNKKCGIVKDMNIWNTESRGSFHEALKKMYGNDYIASEYFGGGRAPGTYLKGIRHEDMCSTSFESNSIDVVFSSDDIEHVHDPRDVLNEIARVLKADGLFIFTAPFNIDSDSNDILAVKNEDGSIDYLKEPQYHGDPLNPSDGILVYTIFGWEIIHMCDQAGIQCKVNVLYLPFYGILGGNAIVFVGQKKKKG